MPAATRPTSQPPTASTGGVMTRDRAWELGRYHGALEAELQETVRDCKWLKDELKTIKKNSDNLKSMLYNADRLRSKTPPMGKQTAVPTPIITAPAPAAVVPAKVLPIVVPDYGAKGVETSVVRYMLAADANGAGEIMDYGHPHQPFAFGVPVAVQRSNSCPMCKSNSRPQRSRSIPKRRLSRQDSGAHYHFQNEPVGYASEVSTSSSIIGAAYTPVRHNSQRRSGSYVNGANQRSTPPPPPPYRSRRRNTSGNVSDYSDVERVLGSSKRQHPRSASATPAQSSADEASVAPKSPSREGIVAPQPRTITVQMQQAVAGPKRPSPKEEANRRLREMIQTHQIAQTVSVPPPPPYVGPTHAHTALQQSPTSAVPSILSSTSIASAMTAPTPTMGAGKMASTLTPHSAPLNTMFSPGMTFTPPPRAFSGSTTSSFSPPTPSVRASPGSPPKSPAFGQVASSGPVLVPMEGSMMSFEGSRRSVNTANNKDGTLGSPQSVKSSASFMPSMASYTIQIDTPNAAAAAAAGNLAVPRVASRTLPMSAMPMPGSLSMNSNQHLSTSGLPVGESWESIDSTIPLGKGKAPVAASRSSSDSEISVRSASSAEGMPASGSAGPRDTTVIQF